MDTYQLSFRAMGCQINVWLETIEDGAALLQAVPDWIETIEASLSRFRPHSELSRVNEHTGQWALVSPILYTALGEAQRAAHFTGGLVTPLILPALIRAGYDRSFEQLHDHPARPTSTPPPVLARWEEIVLDPAGEHVWLPGPIDLGGTAKGWTATEIADRLAEHGSCLVDLGGDIVARGKPWPVEIFDPFHPDTPFAILTLENNAVATSGTDFRRWGAQAHHIIDPRTGAPAQSDAISVTVVHPDAVLAEAAAKMSLLLGSLDGLTWLAQQAGFAGLTFDQSGQVLATENVQSFFTPLEIVPNNPSQGA